MISEQGDTEPRLTGDQLKTLRERLVRVEAELVARLGAEQAVALEGERLAEPMDMAEQTREQEDAVLFTNRDRALLQEVRRALAKFETGRYGLSEISGRPIELRRLEVIPWARTEADET